MTTLASAWSFMAVIQVNIKMKNFKYHFIVNRSVDKNKKKITRATNKKDSES